MSADLPSTMKYVAMTGKGGPEVLTIKEAPLPDAGPDEVLISVAAAGVNRPDLAQRQGLYPPPPDASPELGLEVAGTVVQASGTRFKVGDRVCALAPGGGYAEYCKVPVRQCLPMPQRLSFLEAAGICETFFTVWANVFQIGGLKAGQRFLVHGGTSGIGTTAIQLARAFGAEVYATAGTAAKVKACLDLGAKAAINYREEDFATRLAELTRGEGVNVILDMVGGDYTQRNIECLALDGRLVQIATLGGAKAAIHLPTLMQKRAVLTGSTLRPRSLAAKGLIAQELHDKVWPLLEAGKVRVVIDKAFPFARAREAHQYLATGEHIGKVILEMHEIH